MADSAHYSGPGRVYVRDTQLADRYDVTRQTIWRWAREGRFPAPAQLTPGTVRWRLDEVEAWERQRREVA